ncbi:MAG: hypothetical protein APF76_06445 [Desulfitibacter sp. BRH_c19]|nr:MAG: hypothetical protein APF76_06445 [Desulfitibacter sp. BRH_c19]
MIRYGYKRPDSLKETCQLLEEYNKQSRVIAGGTDLLVQLRGDDSKYIGLEYLIDISFLKELDYILEDNDVIRIGALTTHDKISKSSLIHEEAYFLAEAVNTVGSPQIRHTGTIGGSVCNASPAADPIPPLVALDAQVKLLSTRGTRVVSLVSIFEKPYSTNIAADEILVEISFKKLPANSKTAFLKVGRRKALAIARINIAVCVTLDDEGKVSEVRISPGSVLPNPGRVTAAEEILLGNKPELDLIDEAGKKVSEEMLKRSGIRWSTEYKKPVIEALTKRCLKKALGVC